MAAAVNSSVNNSEMASLQKEDSAVENTNLEGTQRKHQICYFFSSKKGCFKGDACTFQHIQRGRHSDNQKEETLAKNEEKVNHQCEGEILANLISGSVKQHKQTDDADEKSNNEQDEELNKNKTSEEQVNIANTEDDSNGTKGVQNKKICYSYSRTKKCRFGDDCKYAHVYKPKEKSTKTVKGATYDPPVETATVTDTEKPFAAMGSKQQIKSQSKKTWRKKLCRYYDWGFCFKGDRCPYWHPLDPQNMFADFENKLHPASHQSNVQSDKEAQNAQSSTTAKHQTVANQQNIMQRYVLSQLGENDLEKLRKTELEQVKKRYPKAEESQEGMSNVFEFLYKMTDPDWVSIHPTGFQN